MFPKIIMFFQTSMITISTFINKLIQGGML